MFDRSVYVIELANKSRYCATWIYGDGINTHCEFLGNWKGIDLNYFVAKEEHHRMIMMYTYYGIMVSWKSKGVIYNVKSKYVHVTVFITILLSLLV